MGFPSNGQNRARSADQALRKLHGAFRHRPGDRAGRVRRASRALRLRQDHDAEHRCGLRGALQRPGPPRWPRPCGRAGEPARHGHRLPELCALPAHDRGGEHLLRAGDARDRPGRARPGDPPGPRPRASFGDERALSTPALWWPAAARRAGAGARHRTRSAAARRTLVQSRRQAARGNAGRDPRDPAPRRHHDDHGHARPGGSTRDLRQDRRDGCRPHRPARRPADAL